MILHPRPSGWAAIPQAAHALLALQLVDHWGNRAVLRPAPRPDLLAAALLHDAGWDGSEDPPQRGSDGVPLAFDSWPAAEREPLWHRAVERAALCGRYVAYLVSHHVVMLAQCSDGELHAGFVAQEQERQRRLRAELAGDPRYAQLLATGADAANRAILRLADAIAVHLCLGAAGAVELPGLPTSAGPAPLTLRPVGERTFRLRPWPLVGRRLVVHAEARLLGQLRFSDQAELELAWQAAPTCRLSWTLLATGAPAD